MFNGFDGYDTKSLSEIKQEASKKAWDYVKTMKE
jgi:hypothetical protein